MLNPTPYGGCSVTIKDPTVEAEREKLLLEAWFLSKESYPLGDFNTHRQPWANWPVDGPTKAEYEQLLLDDWFRTKEVSPRTPYNAHVEHVVQYGRSLRLVLHVKRLVAEGNARPLQPS